MGAHLECAASAKIARARQTVLTQRKVANFHFRQLPYQCYLEPPPLTARATQPLQLQLHPPPGIIDCPRAPYAHSTFWGCEYPLSTPQFSLKPHFKFANPATSTLFQGCSIHVLVVSAPNVLLPLLMWLMTHLGPSLNEFAPIERQGSSSWPN